MQFPPFFLFFFLNLFLGGGGVLEVCPCTPNIGMISVLLLLCVMELTTRHYLCMMMMTLSMVPLFLFPSPVMPCRLLLSVLQPRHAMPLCWHFIGQCHHALCILISRKWLRSWTRAGNDLGTLPMSSFWYFFSHDALHVAVEMLFEFYYELHSHMTSRASCSSRVSCFVDFFFFFFLPKTSVFFYFLLAEAFFFHGLTYVSHIAFCMAALAGMLLLVQCPCSAVLYCTAKHSLLT